MEEKKKQWETLGFQVIATKDSTCVPGTLIATASSLDLAHTISTIPELQEENRRLKEEVKRFKFMIDNGLGWEDMVNDIKYPNEM